MHPGIFSLLNAAAHLVDTDPAAALRANAVDRAARQAALLGRAFDRSFFLAAVDDMYRLLDLFVQAVAEDPTPLTIARAETASDITIVFFRAMGRGDTAGAAASIAALESLRHRAPSFTIPTDVPGQTLRPGAPLLS